MSPEWVAPFGGFAFLVGLTLGLRCAYLFRTERAYRRGREDGQQYEAKARAFEAEAARIFKPSVAYFQKDAAYGVPRDPDEPSPWSLSPGL